MKRLILLSTFLFLNLAFLSAQILFEEDFEGGSVPPGWAIQTNASDGGWSVGTAASISSNAFSIPSNGSSNVAGTNDDACNCDKSDEYFVMPAIDLSDETAVTLKFDAYYLDNTYEGNQEDATIEVSLDGINWEVLADLEGTDSWNTHNVDLSDYAGESTVYIGFRYDDGSGWLYGFAIDNVSVEVPPSLEAELVSLNSRAFGEVNTALAIKGIIYNGGVTPINAFEFSYTIDGGAPVVETIDGLNIPPFTNYAFETASPWTPTAPGIFTIEATITTVNGETDENTNNNSDTFSPEIFEEVIVPNKMDDFLSSLPVITEITGAASSLNKPTDLDFFPILGKNELWVINQRTEGAGGSTLTISDATTENPSNFSHLSDDNAWHFMSLPTGIAFSDDNFNFASSTGVKDANHNGGTFTGPTLWSSDPAIYTQPSGGNGSHLDMLHGSPFCMGIAHEVDNVFWVYDDWNNDIVRYDFVEDHGPGNDDHSDGVVRRYGNIGINTDGDIPNHLILDKSTGWLYFVDNGNDRVMRLDINTGTASTIPIINETLAEHSRVSGFTSEVVINTGLDRPCGIEIFENRLLVGDYATGDIIIFDMENDFEELGRIATEATGLTGIKVGPDGNIWFTNRVQNKLSMVQPGDVSGASTLIKQIQINVSPNPTSGLLNINIPDLDNNAKAFIRLNTITGKEVLSIERASKNQELDLSNLPDGVYMLHVQGSSFSGVEKIVLNK